MQVVQKALIKKGDKILLLKRSHQAVHFPGYWDFPGGKLEKGEDPVLGIEREVFEETGFKIKATKVLGKYSLDLLKAGHPTHEFIVYETRGEISDPKLSEEHSDFIWQIKKDILKLKIEPFMKNFFAKNG